MITKEETQTLTWKTVLAGEKQKPYFRKILEFLKEERAKGKTIYPPQKDIFNALKHTPYENVKVVIFGQDPYHNPNQAHGLAFSVKKGIKPPPSLRNIFKEIHADLGLPVPTHGCLEKWADQGVLLLNPVLTVEKNKPQSHSKLGWQQFTDKVVESLNDHPESIVFLLWGAAAQRKGRNIDTSKHHILKSTHPSPLAAHRGFLGCRHFSKANKILAAHGRTPIDWSL